MLHSHTATISNKATGDLSFSVRAGDFRPREQQRRQRLGVGVFNYANMDYSHY